MIPYDRGDVLEAGLRTLEVFGAGAGIRGRFVALYLGLRSMRTGIRSLGDEAGTPASEIEDFLDRMFTKTHRPEPFVVLTAPFGQGSSPQSPYSTRSGAVAPGNKYPTNTWRNNFGIQKGIGCPASATVIGHLLNEPGLRLACPHMAFDPEKRQVCTLASTAYRGEEHSIWLRLAPGGYQVVDLNVPSVYQDYLMPTGHRIPIFALMAVLYSFAPPEIYPSRDTVGIPDFASDFEYSLEQVESIFDCDPESQFNSAILSSLDGISPELTYHPSIPQDESQMPLLGPAAEINTGLGAELAAAADLRENGWKVTYRGNQRNLGYDLEATREQEILYVEVKSSVSFTTPELTSSEWTAAQAKGPQYVLAVVDFYGADSQSLWYVRDPAATSTPVERTVQTFRLPRADLVGLGTEIEFL